jgi:hypothetical protein
MFVMSLEVFRDTFAWFWASDSLGPPVVLMCDHLAGALTHQRLQNGLNPSAHAVNVSYLINRSCAPSVPRQTHFFVLYAISNRQDSLYFHGRCILL